ncbi:hypothetical protein [Promicromonospora sukumoe]|uniref:hypothetical protein n=1 Tax=Promicromonospora sukumoe TaxID=88382 RepID=UPI003660C4D7
MSWDLPDLAPESWVALIASGVALVVGLLGAIIGPIVGARSARRTLDGQRRMAADARVWAKRAETYEALLDWAGMARTRLFMLLDEAVESRNAEGLGEFADEVEYPPNVQVGLAAYASDAVNSAAREFLTSLEEVTRLAMDAVENPDEMKLATVTVLTLQHSKIGDQMAQIISDDLHEVLEPDYGRPRGSR